MPEPVDVDDENYDENLGNEYREQEYLLILPMQQQSHTLKEGFHKFLGIPCQTKINPIRREITGKSPPSKSR